MMAGDSKYGRLFTERDVKLLMRFAYLEGREGAVYDRDDAGILIEAGRELDAPPAVGTSTLGTAPGSRPTGRGAALLQAFERGVADTEPFSYRLTFPPDEPLFLIRGQDAFALGAVGDYARRCRDGVKVGDGLAVRHPGLAHLKALNAGWEAIEKWQREHPDRVKVPD